MLGVMLGVRVWWCDLVPRRQKSLDIDVAPSLHPVRSRIYISPDRPLLILKVQRSAHVKCLAVTVTERETSH